MTVRRWFVWLWVGASVAVGCASPPVPMSDAAGADTVVDVAARPDDGVCEDLDNDGHPSAACGGDDCDDGDPRRNPGIREVCDNLGVDEDCDPCTVAQIMASGRGGDGDLDGDGFPSSACFNVIAAGAAPVCSSSVVVGDAGADGGVSVERVVVANGRVTGTDCADNPSEGGGTRFPGATEVCNTVDDNCNGTPDEGVAFATCYADADRDGFAPMSASSMTMNVCAACPAGYTLRAPEGANVDCDDADSARYPGNVENCDGKDNDCSPLTDDAANDARVGRPCMGSGGGVGRCATASGACVMGAIQCAANTAILEMCNGVDDDCDGMTDEPQCVDATLDAMGRQTANTGYGVCDGSTCVVSRCVDFRGDCDGDPRNACETNLNSDPNHCGGCGVRCSSGECVAGVCGNSTTVEVSAGSDHTCVRNANGTVLCWGANGAGQLGDGTTTNRSDPATVLGVAGALEIDTGASHTCARLSSGRVMCWGANTVGQLGNGGTVASRMATLVSSIMDAVEIAAGGRNTCARTMAGAVLCWGDNTSGQVGDGTMAPSGRAVPTPVLGVTDAVEISVGVDHACARTRSGSVQCWGRNTTGQLGNRMTADSARAVDVMGLIDAEQISAGNGYTCARRRGGTVVCWGDGTQGRLGNGSTTMQPLPVSVASLAGVATLEVGPQHGCAARADGRLSCWGGNGAGQLGDGTYTDRSMPVEVTGITDAIAVSSGDFHTCVVRRAGQVECWGRNASGQLGDGTLVARNTPRPVTYNDIVSLAAGQSHTCARRSNGQVSCWGANTWGQLGDGATTALRSAPAPVMLVNDATDVSAGHAHTCATRSNGELACWGANTWGQLGDGTTTQRPTTVRGTSLTNVVEARMGQFFSCARTANGQVFCWGYNAQGQLGDRTTTSRSSLGARVDALDDAVEITAGAAHACARRRNGEVRCWGSNFYGQLGDGLSSNATSPTRVRSLPEAVEVAAGLQHTCARTAQGTIYCWGFNGNGQLGDGTLTGRNDAALVPGITDAVELAVGHRHNCVRRASGQVLCWGFNQVGQLGDGTRSANRTALVSVVGLTDATSLVAGERHTCARRRDRSIVCWGSNSFGQSGQSTTNRLVPVAVTGVVDARQISAGDDHVCARLGSGAVQCWGSNFYGQLGRGDNTSSATPVSVVEALGGPLAAADVTAGAMHTCARRSATATAVCWGNNFWGQLGDSMRVDRNSATSVLDLTMVSQVSGGERHSCAVNSDRTINCWGANAFGQLGNGSTMDAFRPTSVIGVMDAIAVRAGGAHSCSIRVGGQVHCWGANARGQLGVNSMANWATPQQVTMVAGAGAISLGDEHTCARLTDSRVFCWGAGGRTGDGTTMQRVVPVEVMGLSNAGTIAAGPSHTCAVRATGQVSCWGFNADGQLGDGTAVDRTAPVSVATIMDAADVASGDGFTCVRRTNNTVACWGSNDNGQLGDGTFSSSSVPVSVAGL